MRWGAVALALLLSGCAGPAVRMPATLTVEASGCTEVGLAVPGDLAAAQAALPSGFKARDARATDPAAPEGRSALLLVVNHCTFRAVSASAREAEVLVWVRVEPPPALALPNATEHAFEVAHWRPRGPLLQLEGELASVAPAAIEGLPEGFADGDFFQVEVRPEAGGSLALSGLAAPAATLREAGGGPCCRTFARGPAGLVAIDYTPGDHAVGSSQCAVQTTLPHLTALLGAGHAGGRCTHNGRYNFTAVVRPLAG